MHTWFLLDTDLGSSEEGGMIVIYFTWPPTMHTGNFLRHCRIGMFFSKPYKKGLEIVKHNIEV